jgi:hypothetical protein
VILPGIGLVVVTGGSLASAPGAGIAAGIATERDSQSIADSGGAFSSAAAATPKSIRTGTNATALLPDIQFNRHSHIAPLRAQIAKISISDKSDKGDENKEEKKFENAQHPVLPFLFLAG